MKHRKLTKLLVTINFLTMICWGTVITFLVFELLKIQFVASPKPLIRYSLSISATLTVFATLAQWLLMIFQKHPALPHGNIKKAGMVLLLIFALPVMNFFAFYYVQRDFIPMLHTLILGRTGITEFQIIDADFEFSSRHGSCYDGIKLNSSGTFSAVCGIPWLARDKFRDGQMVNVQGRTSNAGVFAKSIRATRCSCGGLEFNPEWCQIMPSGENCFLIDDSNCSALCQYAKIKKWKFFLE